VCAPDADAAQGLNVDVVGQSSMFTGDEEMFAFARCCSRLVEMGSRQWAAAAGAGGAESG
jgi:protein AFG1